MPSSKLRSFRVDLLYSLQLCPQVWNLPTLIRAHDSMITSILLIQRRPKMSKSSPFPKRNNPMKKQREDVRKSMPGISKMNKEKAMDRPFFIDSPGICLYSDVFSRFYIL